MLGVTLFGIFLTPVFFYVIESLVEAPLFTSARARQVGGVLFYAVGILTLGLPWLLRLLLGKPVRRPVPAKPHLLPAARDGNGNGNGSVAPFSRERPASAEAERSRDARG
jgi:multidrug efflux pump